MERKFFSKPAFWVNVITLVFVGFLVATFVFGWSPPQTQPGVGGGAISIDISGNINVGNKRITSLQNFSTYNDTDAANKAFVTSAVAGAGAGIITLWGSCQDTVPGGVCSPGEFTFGSPTCESISEYPGEWRQLYAGYGPFTFYENFNGNFEPTDSMAICRPDDQDLNVIFGANPGILGLSNILYVAKYPYLSGEIANTCRVCIK